MALPTIIGSIFSRNNGTSAISIAPDVNTVSGQYMVAAFEANTPNVSFSSVPTGWVQLLAPLKMGTRTAIAYAKIRASGESSYSFTLSANALVSYSVTTFDGAADISQWVIGAGNARPASSTTTVAPSITTTVANTKVFSISFEATSATETESQVTVSGATKYAWQEPTPTPIESFFLSYIDKTSPGASGDITVTYPNAASNGAAFSVGIVPAVSSTPTRPSIVGTIMTGSNTNSNSISLSKPSGVANGDWLVAILRTQDASATSDFTLSGWSRIGTAFSASSAQGRSMGFFAKYIGSASAETATSYTFTWTGTVSRVVGAVFRVQGADPARLVEASSPTYLSGIITNGSRLAPYASNDANGLQLAIAGNEQVSPNASESVSHTTAYTLAQFITTDTNTASTRTTMELYQRNQDAGATPQMDVVWAGASGNNIISVVLRGANSTNNAAPTAGFTTVISGLGVTVTDASTDSDGTIVAYGWDFGDSTTATGVSPAAHTYASAGTYTISLTVTDNGGAVNTVTHAVTVAVPVVGVAPTRKGYMFLDPSTANAMVLDPAQMVSGGTALATGNWMIAAITTIAGTTTVTAPSGWTVIKGFEGPGSLRYEIFAKIRQAGDTTYTFTLDTNGNTAAAALFWGAGADPTISNWIIGATTNRSIDLHNTGAPITTSKNNSLVLGLSLERTTASETAITSLTGASEWFFMPQYSTFQLQTLDVAYVDNFTPAGTTTSMEWVYPNSQSLNGAAFQIAIPPAPVNNNITLGYPAVLRQSSTNYNGKMFYWDGTAAHDFTTTPIIKFKPVTVTEFLSAQRAPWFGAHRGFSYSYPEETLYSYRGATDFGIKAIEISVQKSADGTFWCFHDATTDRTTGFSGTISSLSDATLSGLNNFGSTAAGNNTQPSRPAAKLVDVLNTYAATHVIIIEDKTYANGTAMLNLMDSYGTVGRPASEIFIWKAYGPSPKASVFDIATARGYHRWAYLFDGDMAANFTATVTSGKADMIGMDYNSSDATLTPAIAACIANGVMPTGHIVNSATQRDRLIGLGMKGIMISNKDIVPPWYVLWPNK